MVKKMNYINSGSYIENVEADTAHGLLCNRTLTGSPLETGDNGIFDFVKVLDSLGLIDE